MFVELIKRNCSHKANECRSSYQLRHLSGLQAFHNVLQFTTICLGLGTVRMQSDGAHFPSYIRMNSINSKAQIHGHILLCPMWQFIVEITSYLIDAKLLWWVSSSSRKSSRESCPPRITLYIGRLKVASRYAPLHRAIPMILPTNLK